MAKRKRKKTPAVTPSGQGSLDIRKISNGYVLTESKIDARGRYTSTETFTETAPKIVITHGTP